MTQPTHALKNVWEPGYVSLAHAVIVLAVQDYRKAARALSINPDAMRSKWQIQEIEQFFRSPLFKDITDLDGERLIKKLRTECCPHGGWDD